MCGITGIYDYSGGKPVDRALLAAMCDSIAHRGPDDEGTYYDDDAGVGLGHRRLSIIDLETGNQPMSDDSGQLIITYNGEIYNFPELKDELIDKGWEFRTTSDTEVILYMYREYGVEGFDRLNGIFAFALYDKTERRMILARDHFGVKPLYYSIEGGRLVFGSEIKPIIMAPGFKRELDFEALNSFLTFRYNPSPQTLFKGIRKLPPGHYLVADHAAEPEVRSYVAYRPHTESRITEGDAIDAYRAALESAVKRQMLSDVPVGLLLSGGVDSAVVGCLMAQASGGKIKTFTVGFPGVGGYNEMEDARISAEYIGSDHHEIELSREEYMDFFFRSFHYLEEPIAETTVSALYYVSRLAASSLKVVLSGQGADEPLAGYKRYFGERYISKYGRLLKLLPEKLVGKLLPRNERFKRALYASRFNNEKERFLGIYTIFTPEMKNGLMKPDVAKLAVDRDLEIIERLYSETDGLSDSLAKILYIDTRKTLSDNLLLFGDKMSMANSLELRVPFLDVELVRFLETVPSGLKLKGRTHKYLHKKAVEKWLPAEIIHRKKRGFETPMDEWLQSDLADTVSEIVSDRASASREYFNVDYVQSMIKLHKERRFNYSRQIFALLSFELWHKSFFLKEYQTPVEAG